MFKVVLKWCFIVLIVGVSLGYGSFFLLSKINKIDVVDEDISDINVNFDIGIPLFKNNYEEKILNGAVPELEDEMIPIMYIDGGWYKADLLAKWYSYEEFNWANVAIMKDEFREKYLDAPDGTYINSSDVLAYFVWIPRFEYKLFNTNFDATYERMIEVRFVGKDYEKKQIISNGEYYTHPAFSVNNNGIINELNGFWIAKFEPSLDQDIIEILPNKRTLVNINMATMWNYAINVSPSYGLEIDSRIITNMEYGAIALLSYSNYGKRNNPDYFGDNKLIFLNTAMGNSGVWDWVLTVVLLVSLLLEEVIVVHILMIIRIMVQEHHLLVQFMVYMIWLGVLGNV